MLQHFRAYYQIETVIIKRQAGNIRRRKFPRAAPMLTQPVVQFEPPGRLAQIVVCEIGSHREDLRQLIGRAGVTAGTAPDVEDFSAGIDVQPAEIDRNHQ